jgi:UDP-N-acetyl-D-glucosamine dehydrogenase
VKIAIIGQGYVGYALSVAATEAGHSVIGFDTNSKLITEIKAKGDLKNYLSTNNEADIQDQDAYIIAVPTPLDEKNLPDLSFLVNAAQLIAISSSKGALVINESTSYPGTLREIVITEI